jgi:hypothetical protein
MSENSSESDQTYWTVTEIGAGLESMVAGGERSTSTTFYRDLGEDQTIRVICYPSVFGATNMYMRIVSGPRKKGF